jgi:predicted XRE-type DNA-binding protein
MLMRSNLMNEIEKYLTTQNWTEAEAAKRLGITQARVAKLKRGMSREFTIEMLVLFAARLGLEPELRLAA